MAQPKCEYHYHDNSFMGGGMGRMGGMGGFGGFGGMMAMMGMFSASMGMGMLGRSMCCMPRMCGRGFW